MSTVLYVGMDVHSTSYSLATFALGEREVRFELKIEPDYEQVLQYLGTVRRQLADTLGEVEFVCGYEVGCLGDTLYHQLTAKGIKCVIVAPTTILEPRSKRRVKTDRRDAALIARSLAFGTYRAVLVLTDEDKSVKDFIRMRDDHQKKLKQGQAGTVGLLPAPRSSFHRDPAVLDECAYGVAEQPQVGRFAAGDACRVSGHLRESQGSCGTS